MPPNTKGGKNYKKGKHTEVEAIMYERAEDQMYGRIIKLLGGCNAIVYCNDNKERLCHIRGTMRKKVWLATGDIVLISLRDLDKTGNTPLSKIDRGDICAKYEKELHKKLQSKDKTFNTLLLTSIETAESSQMNGGGARKAADMDEGFEFAEDSDDDTNDDEESSTDEKNIIVKPGPDRRAQKKAMQQQQDDSDIDVDAI
jgi:translation initiation factor 1A